MKLISKSKKGQMTGDKVVNAVIGVTIIASLSGGLYATLVNSTGDATFEAIPLVGTLSDNGLIGILFGVAVFFGIWGYLRLSKR